MHEHGLEELKEHEDFDEEKTTVIYAHGFNEDPDSDTATAIEEAFLDNGNYNYVILDWSKLAKRLYPSAVDSQDKVGKLLGKLLCHDLDETVKVLPKIHLTGFSLGGLLMGAAAQECKDSGHLVNSLDVIEPAGPLNYLLPFFRNQNILTSSDAKIVRVWFTDRGLFSHAFINGTITIYVNGGSRFQPGCPKFDLVQVPFTPFQVPVPVVPFSQTKGDLCNHLFGPAVYAKAVSGEEKGLYACRKGSKTQRVKLGVEMKSTDEGSYTLKTAGPPTIGLGDSADACM